MSWEFRISLLFYLLVKKSAMEKNKHWKLPSSTLSVTTGKGIINKMIYK